MVGCYGWAGFLSSTVLFAIFLFVHFFFHLCYILLFGLSLLLNLDDQMHSLLGNPLFSLFLICFEMWERDFFVCVYSDDTNILN